MRAVIAPGAPMLLPLVLALLSPAGASPETSGPVGAYDASHPGPMIPRVDGHTWVEQLPGRVTGPFDPNLYDHLLEEAAGRKPDHLTAVRLDAEGPDGVVRPLLHYLPEPVPAPDKVENPPAERSSLRSMPVDHPGVTGGALMGKAVYVSQCHGWIWSSPLNRFATQRGNNFDTVEDLHNPEGANFYLVRYLENAGARVFTTGERDPNPNQVIVDDADPGYTETGSGFEAGLAGFGRRTTYPYGTNPFTSGGTRRFPADGGGVATWAPEVPADGHYAVYVSWDADANHATSAHYRITHPGGVIDRWYDQTNHGSTWQYVETLWLPEGPSITVELIGDGNEAGRSLSADAVRIGGGTGDVVRNNVTTNRPRWEEGAILYTQYNGAPTSIYDPYTSGDGSDPTSRSKWAKWEHPSWEDAVYLSWHSNAASGTARGTVTYFAGGGTDAPAGNTAQCSNAAVTGSYSLSKAVQDEMAASFKALWDPTWNDRGVATACFSEVSPTHNDEMPSTLVELAFHDNGDDALHLKHPKFRRDASRAMYRGIVRYFAERDGQVPRYLPEPPVQVAMVHEAPGELRLSWADGPTGAPFGDAPDFYTVYLSSDGRSWDNGTEVNATSTIIRASEGTSVYARVAAVNAGGSSFPSEVVGARVSPHGWAPVLVVAAFDRLDRGLLNWVNPHASLGNVVRMDLYAMNTYDIVGPHGRAIAEAGWYFDAVSDEHFEVMDLSSYDLIVWATGEESTVDETFSSVQQDIVRAFVEAGGSLWTSGAEILWDLDYTGSDSDRAFATEILGVTMVADGAESTRVDGEGLLAHVGPMDFAMSDGAPYPVEWPDVLGTDGEVIARYGDGGIAGALNGRVAVFGWPFETIGDPAVRTEVARALLEALVPDYVPPDPGGDDDDDDAPSVDQPDLPGSPRIASASPKGCGCGGGDVPPLLGVMLAAMLTVLRRRR